MSRTPLLRAFQAAAIMALLGVLVLPWFHWSDRIEETTTEDWGLVTQAKCSDFARPAVECRTEVDLFDDVVWLLVPIFAALRLWTVAVVLLLTATLGARLAGRASSAALRSVSIVALLTFAILIGAMPGDTQLREEYAPTWVAFLALAAALSGYVMAAIEDGPRTRRESLGLAVGVGAALLILLASLWSPWITEPEAVDPVDVEEQSAYSYGTLAEIHHWHGHENREHYEEDGVRLGLELDGEHVAGFATAVAGCVLAALLLASAARRGPRRFSWPIAGAAVVFLGLGVLFVALTIDERHRLEDPRPAAGAIFAILGAVAAVVHARLATARAHGSC